MLFVAVLALGAMPMFAAGGGAVTGNPGAGATPESYANVTVIIPAVIGIDVESDATYDLSGLSAQAAPGCANNAFPLHPSCTGTYFFNYTSSTHTGTGNAVNTGGSEVWMAVFSNDTSVTHTLAAKTDGAYTGPGMYYTAAGAAGNNANAWGNATLTQAAVGTYGTIATVASGSTFNWVRADQVVKFALNGALGNPAPTPALGTATKVWFRISR